MDLGKQEGMILYSQGRKKRKKSIKDSVLSQGVGCCLNP